MNFIKYFDGLKHNAANTQQHDHLDSTKTTANIDESTLKPKDLVDNSTEPDKPNIYCPNCHSSNIQLLTLEQQLGTHHFRYLCLVCRSRFNDDTKSPFEFKVPPLEVWLQCWFLLGCYDSLEYVAAKLNLDIKIVKQMIKELQNTFNINRPTTQNMSYEKWSEQHSLVHTRIKEEILGNKRKQELLQGDTTVQPLDTAEIRRQKNKKSSSEK